MTEGPAQLRANIYTPEGLEDGDEEGGGGRQQWGATREFMGTGSFSPPAAATVAEKPKPKPKLKKDGTPYAVRKKAEPKPDAPSVLVRQVNCFGGFFAEDFSPTLRTTQHQHPMDIAMHDIIVRPASPEGDAGGLLGAHERHQHTPGTAGGLLRVGLPPHR
jgi:hypothetical protein